MGPASKTSGHTSSRHIGEVDAVVSFEPKKMVKEEMTGGKIESKVEGKKLVTICSICIYMVCAINISFVMQRNVFIRFWKKQ